MCDMCDMCVKLPTCSCQFSTIVERLFVDPETQYKRGPRRIEFSR